MLSQVLTSEQISELAEWDKAREYPTPDEVIDAFQKGVEKSSIAEKTAINKQHIENIKSAINLSREAILHLNKVGVRCSKFFINVNDFGNYEVIFAVDENQYLDDKKRNASYDYLRGLKKDRNESSFKLSFSLMPVSGEINRKTLFSDGFWIKVESNG